MSSSQGHQQVVVFCIEALTVGGAEQMLVVMANQFAERNWLVHMVCLSKPGELAGQLHKDVRLHVLNKRPGIDWRLPLKLRRLLISLKPHVVNSHLWVANLWVRLSLINSPIPVVVTEHSRDVWKPSHYRLLDRWLISGTHCLVAVSEDTANFYRHDIGIPNSRICVINNGVNTQRYAAGKGDELRHQCAPNQEVLIGTVGRLVSAKNHLRLLDMAALLVKRRDEQDSLPEQPAHESVAGFIPDFKILIVGEGPERASIEKGIKERNLSAVVLLAGERNDIPDVLSALDIFVLSSDREGHPLTALEAQAAGTPVVLTKAGGSADAIASEDENAGGFLVEQDASALATAVAKLMSDSALRQQMSGFAQQYALANFDKEQMVERYEAVFAGVSEKISH